MKTRTSALLVLLAAVAARGDESGTRQAQIEERVKSLITTPAWVQTGKKFSLVGGVAAVGPAIVEVTNIQSVAAYSDPWFTATGYLVQGHYVGQRPDLFTYHVHYYPYWESLKKGDPIRIDDAYMIMEGGQVKTVNYFKALTNANDIPFQVLHEMAKGVVRAWRFNLQHEILQMQIDCYHAIGQFKSAIMRETAFPTDEFLRICSRAEEQWPYDFLAQAEYILNQMKAYEQQQQLVRDQQWRRFVNSVETVADWVRRQPHQ